MCVCAWFCYVFVVFENCVGCVSVFVSVCLRVAVFVFKEYASCVGCVALCLSVWSVQLYLGFLWRGEQCHTVTSLWNIV